MASQAQYGWNHPVMLEGATKEAIRTESETKAAVLDLIKQGKGNLYITAELGISYTEVVSIRNLYEKKARSSGN